MFPIALDLSRIRILLVGKGDAFTRRLEQLKETGATSLTLYENELPEAHQIKQASILMVVGLDDETSTVLCSIARLQGVLVNVEDKPDLCDFYFTSFIRHGDLTIAVSTNGKSPTLAQEIKKYLGTVFHECWANRVADISKNRLSWRAQGMNSKEVAEKTREIIEIGNWLTVKKYELNYTAP